MPHYRKRLILAVLEKRLRLFPVVGLLGARQTGKSTTIRDQLSSLRKIKYITLDRAEDRKRAEDHPTLFITSAESKGIKTLCIDEVQKVPQLFDTLKAEVDQQKRPGRFLVSGSTEFSKKSGVRESLTGRIALLRLFPLNMSEIYLKPTAFSLKEVHLWCERGGMPGMFAIRDSNARAALIQEWLETTCTRDLAHFQIASFNPDLGRRILAEVATLEHPTCLEISRAVGKPPRQVMRYLQAFQALFILYEIEPAPTSVGKSRFYLFDAGIADHLGSTLHRCLQVYFLNQCFSHYANLGAPKPDVFHYETTRGSRIDFVLSMKKKLIGYQITQNEAPGTYELRASLAYENKHPNAAVRVLAPCLDSHFISKSVSIIPWGILQDTFPIS